MTTIDTQAPAPAAPYIPNPNTVARSSTVNGVTTMESGSGYRSTDAPAAAPAAQPQATLVSTIKSQWGRPLTGSEVRPDSLIDIGNGMTTSVRNAAGMGLIRQGAGGVWEDANGAPVTPPATPKATDAPEDQTPAASAIEPLDPAGEAIAGEFISKVGNMDSAKGIQNLLDTGSLSPDVAARAATAMGITPDEVNAKAATLREAFAVQGHAAVGPGSEAVFAWASRERAGDLRKAALEQVNNGSTAGYKDLARQFYEEMPSHSLDAIMNSPDAKERGIKVDQRTGKVTLDIPGIGRTDWKTAVRQGFIGPKFAGSNPTAQAPANRQPSQVDVDYLKANPTSAVHFDKHFGEGAARRYL